MNKQIIIAGILAACAAIPRQRSDQILPEILTIQQSQSAIAAAAKEAQGFLPMILLGLYAGLRSIELERIPWAAIGPDQIHVGPDVAKTRQQRYVRIQPNLRAWLDELGPGRAGRVCPRAQKATLEHFREIRAKAQIDRWPQNAMRHSFATYHLALTQDAPATALQLGHRGVDILFQHYRALATQAQGVEYFSLTPEKLAKIRPELS